MTGAKSARAGEPFVMMPRSLLESPAWRALGIHARRLVDFLLIEHLSHGGRHNGALVAPRRQLESFGIGSHFISAAVAEAEHVGVIDHIRGVGRAPSRYALTWLPMGDTPPTHRWRACQEAAEAIKAQKVKAKTR
jgi:hypothetical protein